MRRRLSMSNDLYIRRKEIQEEISEREENLSRLNKETSLLENKNNQAKMIQEALNTHYEELQKKHYIDRGQENEIKRVISSKKIAVDSEISYYYSHNNSISNSYNRTISDLNFKKNWDYRLRQGIFEYTSDYNKRIKPIEKEYDKAAKEAEKERDATLKVNAKSCIDNLKRLFGELEVDIKRFYKKGISADNLNELISIMDDICNRGSKIGTIPQSNQQKVYKWQQEAKNAPIDEERINNNKEEQARAVLKEKVSNAKTVLNQSKDLLDTKEKELIDNTKKIEQLITDANQKACSLNVDIGILTTEAEEKKKSVEDKYNKDVVKLTRKTEKQKKEIQDNVNEITKEINALEIEKERLFQERQEKEIELSKTFLLSFNKKKALKEKIDQLAESRSKTTSQIKEKQREIELEQLKNPDSELESELNKKKEKLDKDLLDIDNQTAININGLTEEITRLKADAKKLSVKNVVVQKYIEELKQRIIDQQNTKTELEKELKDFHTNYLIKTFGKQYGVSSTLAEYRKRILADTLKIVSLKKELSEVEKEIRTFEKEEKKRKDELQKEITRQAKEKEQARKEQEERQLRVKKELQAKEKEQEIIKDKNADFDITVLMSELENDPCHYLLSPDVNPFEEDNKKTITNSIVRKQLIQKKTTPECNEYLLFFVDATGNIISDQRLVRQMPVGEKTTVSFELKSNNGFNKNNYYLMILNFITYETISATRYKINISFSNDFDF